MSSQGQPTTSVHAKLKAGGKHLRATLLSPLNFSMSWAGVTQHNLATAATWPSSYSTKVHSSEDPSTKESPARLDTHNSTQFSKVEVKV